MGPITFDLARGNGLIHKVHMEVVKLWLVMHKHPQAVLLHSKFLLDGLQTLIIDIFEQWQLALPQIAKTLNIPPHRESQQIECLRLSCRIA